MNKLAAGLIFVAFSQLMPVAAQTKPENNLSPRMRIYQPKYLNYARSDQVSRFVHSVISSVSIHWEPVVNGLVLDAGMAAAQSASEELDKAEALLKRFDVPEPPPTPERQIEMTVSLIRAFADAGRVQGSVPPELAPVVKEMKGALTYAGFSLVDTIQVIVRDGLKLEDALPSGVTGVSIPHFYNLTFERPRVSTDGKTVSLMMFHFGVKIPVATSNGVLYQDEGITTPLTIYEGQKLVLGKVKTNVSSNDDLFVVLSCKVK
jgi:hypothetical protein